MLKRIKEMWLAKVYQWTEEINNDRMIEALKEILETPKGDNYDSCDQINGNTSNPKS